MPPVSTTTSPPREYVPCNLCGSEETRTWAQVGAATVVRCRRCGLVYTNPRPVLEALTGGYEADYSAQHQDPELLRQRRLMYQVEQQEILNLLGVTKAGRSLLETTEGPDRQGIRGDLSNLQGKRFLDVGCGTGEFLAALPPQFEVYGVDVSQTYIRYGREQLGLPNLQVGQLSEVGFAAADFDVVQMRGVLQHLPDPASQLTEAHRVLKPGGLLVISATPNIASPAARVFREHFRLLAPDQMLYDFSPETLSALLDKTGFRGQTFTFPYRQTPYYHWHDGLVFIGRALQLLWGKALARDVSALKSPPFARSMMTCYALK